MQTWKKDLPANSSIEHQDSSVTVVVLHARIFDDWSCYDDMIFRPNCACKDPDRTVISAPRALLLIESA